MANGVRKTARCNVKNKSQLEVALGDLARGLRQELDLELQSGFIVLNRLVEFFCRMSVEFVLMSVRGTHLSLMRRHRG